MPDSWLLLLLAAAGAFLIGSSSPAAIVARVLKGDLSAGSGNPGATNVGRLFGVRMGVLVGVADVLKGFVPTLLALLYLDRPSAYAVGLAAVLGHMFSPFLGWRGGKGVATAAGALLAVLPLVAAVSVAIFVAVLLGSRWMALSSLSACLTMIVSALVMPLPEPEAVGRAWLVVLALLVIARHHRNIRAFWLRQRRRRS